MPSEEIKTQIPQVLWAQRNDKLFITIAADDIENPDIKMSETHLKFNGKSGKGISYALDVQLYKEIDTQESKSGIYGQKHWMFILKKKETGPYWPRLLKDSSKVHWLKADWNKWKDEDEEDEGSAGGAGEDPSGMDFGNMFQQMGGMGGGMPGGMGSDDLPDLDDLDKNDEVDSDDEKLPDLEEKKE